MAKPAGESRKVDLGPYRSRFGALHFDDPTDFVLQVTLPGDGPASSMSPETHTDLTDLWPVVDRDPSIRAVVVRGEGRNFSGGGNFDLTRSAIDDADTRARLLRETRDMIYNLINCSTPIVAGVRGHALGAGLSIALLSDITVVGTSTRIIDGHTRLGVPAGDHAVMVWPLLCGLAKAKYYLLSCETLTGPEAERIGLVSLCVDDDEVDRRALAVAERVVRMSPFAVQWTKQSLNNWLRLAGPMYDASLALEFLSFTGTDVLEGIASHEERREPDFQGAVKRVPRPHDL